MTNIYWKSPGGTIHTIPEGSTVYVVGSKDMTESWVDEDGFAANKYHHVGSTAGRKVISCNAVDCPTCGSELISSTTGGRVKYCPKDGCEKLYRCVPAKT